MFFEFLGIYMERNTINSIKNYIDIDFTTKFNIYNRIYPDIKIIYCGSPLDPRRRLRLRTLFNGHGSERKSPS
jgi:hypothetical protein